MTTLERIRSRAGLLVAIVGFALLAFVLGDLFRSGNFFWSESPNELGKIGTQVITNEEFDARVNVAKENMMRQQQRTELDEQSIDMVRNQSWNQLVYESLITKQYDKLGINVSKEELFDMVQGKNPHPQIIQAFTDPKTGKFSPSTVIQFINNLDQQTPETRQQWIDFEKGIKSERLSSKYNSLLNAGLYVTKAEAKANYLELNRLAKFQYVTKRYTDLPDSLFKPSESETQTYYNAHKNTYKQEESLRTFEYVMFEPLASPDDIKAAEKEIATIGQEFAATKEDSAFVQSNSDGEINFSYVKNGSLGILIDSAMFRASEGYTTAPYFENNTFKVAKLMSIKNMPDSVKARHILIKPINNDMVKTKAKADSIKKLITDKVMPFEQLAFAVSEDEGSKIKGGDLGWFKENMMVKPFNDACFFGKVGDMPVVESQFGIHIIEITGKGAESKRVQVGVVERLLRPSSKTFQQFYGKAADFQSKTQTAEAFDKEIVAQGLNKRIASDVKELDKNLPGLTGAREVIKWVYNNKKMTVSSVFEADGKFVVAKITNIKDKGILPLDAVKEIVEASLRKDKKAEKLMTDLASVSTLDAAATKTSSVIQTADNTNFGTGFIPGVGREVDVLSFVFTGKVGQQSKIIKGDNGVYMVKVESFIEAKPSVDNYKQNKETLQSQLKQRVDYDLFEALKQKVDIKDNRARFM